MNNVPIPSTDHDPHAGRNVPPALKPGSESPPLEVRTGVLGVTEMLLKTPGRIVHQLQQPVVAKLAGSLLGVSVVCLLFYGLIIGLFSGQEQLWAAPAKTVVGLLLSALLCFPSLYIFACLCGAEAKVSQVAGVLLGSVALTSILLVGFGPAAWVFTVSTESIGFMGFLHLLFLLIGLFLGLRFLFKGFSLLGGQRDGYLVLWSLIFILVTLQMTTALRPLLGRADTFLPKEKKFFVVHWADCMSSPARSSARHAPVSRP